MVKKVDFIPPYGSQYSALHYFTKKIYEAWLRAGYETRLFKDASEALHVMRHDPPDLMMGFNGIPREEEALFCDILKRPFLTLTVDPFYRFIDVLTTPYSIIGCDDFSGYTALKNSNFNRTLFVPHAVEVDLAPNPLKERIYDITLLATFIDHEKRKNDWEILYPAKICQAMNRAVEKTFSDQQTSFTEATFNELNLMYLKHPELKTYSVDVYAILCDIELYIKGKERIDMLKAIHSTPIHIFGHTTDVNDWKKYADSQNHLIIHEPVPYEKSLEIMQQSKIVLNCSIKNKYGAHERIFAGLAAGALVLTNENPYLAQYFSHDIDIAFYQFNQLSKVDTMIKEYLSDGSRREQIVQNGREVVMTYHTWDARVKTLESELPAILENM